MRRAVILLKWALFALIPSLLLVVGAELVFRSLWINYHAHDPGTAGRFEDGCYRPSLSRGYEPIPGRCGRNAHGMMARRGDAAKPSGGLRVLVLGDSIADQRLWVEVMEARLQTLRPGFVIDTWNAGVGGYDTCSELNVYLEHGAAADADIVLLQYCLNDLTLGSAAVMPLGGGRSRLFAGETYLDLPNLLFRSRLATWAALRYGIYEAGRVGIHSRARGFEESGRCLLGLKTAVEAQGAILRVAAFPPLFSDEASPKDKAIFHLGYDWGREVSRDLFDRMGLPALDLAMPLEAHGGLRQFRHQPDDPWHPDTRGQEILGDALADWLVQWMPGPMKDEPGPTAP